MQRQAWLVRDGGFPASGASQPVGPPVVPERVFPQVERSPLPRPQPPPLLCGCCLARGPFRQGSHHWVTVYPDSAGRAGSRLCSLIRGPPGGALPKASCGSDASSRPRVARRGLSMFLGPGTPSSHHSTPHPAHTRLLRGEAGLTGNQPL